MANKRLLKKSESQSIIPSSVSQTQVLLQQNSGYICQFLPRPANILTIFQARLTITKNAFMAANTFHRLPP